MNEQSNPLLNNNCFLDKKDKGTNLRNDSVALLGECNAHNITSLSAGNHGCDKSMQGIKHPDVIH